LLVGVDWCAIAEKHSLKVLLRGRPKPEVEGVLKDQTNWERLCPACAAVKPLVGGRGYERAHMYGIVVEVDLGASSDQQKSFWLN
jgi:hypothetical protein